MTRHVGVALVGVVLASVLSAGMMAQGRGRGYGGGMGRGGAGVCRGAGYGWNAGRGAGGWWTRVNPTTPEQQAFVKQVTDLHNQIRALNLEIAGLRASNAPADQIAAREQQVASLRAELARVTAANEKLLRDMGIPAPYGVCNGQGPAGKVGANVAGAGRGIGAGAARGNGMGLRNGTGPNPYCPLKK